MKRFDWFSALVAVLFAVLVAGIVIAKLDQRNMQRAAAQLAGRVAEVQAERELTLDSLRVLNHSLTEVKRVNDSLKQVIALKEQNIFKVKARLSEILDSLSKIPSDTVYLRLQAVYPVSDTLPRPYPFAAPQIAGMYSTFIYSRNVTTQLTLTEDMYGDCRKLNLGLSSEISLLENKVSLLKVDIKNANSQRDYYWNDVQKLNNKLQRSRYVKYGLGGLALFFGVVAAL
jgi:hypothetical protein